MAEVVRAELETPPNLFLVGSYSVGKETTPSPPSHAPRSGGRRMAPRADPQTHRVVGQRPVPVRGRRARHARRRADRRRSREIGLLTMMTPTRTLAYADSDAAPPPCRVRVTPMRGRIAARAVARTLRGDRSRRVDPGSEPWCRFDRRDGATRASGGAIARESAAARAIGADPDDRASLDRRRRRGEGGTTRGRDGFVASGRVVDEEASARVKWNRRKGRRRRGILASGSGSGSAAALAASWRPWIENDGATRCYSVPYSEHSSFDELVAFVARVRPVKVPPR